MNATQQRLALLFVLSVIAFAMVRNMLYIVSFDALTSTNEGGGLDSTHLGDRVHRSTRPGEVPPAAASTTRRLASALAAAAARGSSAALPPPQGLNGSIDAANKTWLQLVNAVEKNHTLLKANMSHVGEIVKQLKEERNSAKVEKPHPFKYVINSPNVCGGGGGEEEPVFLLVYVHTAPDHYKRRTVIRQTWGNMLQYEQTVRVVFFMGVTHLGRELNASSAQKALYFEEEQYQDLVQEDFLDTYHNLTHKGVSALKWITHNCRQATFLLKTDDDIFVNMFTLLRHLRRMATRGEEYTRDLLMCAVWYGMPVMRTGKWKVTEEEWKEEYYPTYCSGSAFVLSTDVAERLYRVSFHVPFFWVDDFYITGLLPLKAGNITHRQFLSTYVLNGDRLEELFTGPSWYLYIFSHLHDLDRIQAVWNKMSRMARGELGVDIRKALPGELPTGTYQYEPKPR